MAGIPGSTRLESIEKSIQQLQDVSSQINKNTVLETESKEVSDNLKSRAHHTHGQTVFHGFAKAAYTLGIISKKTFNAWYLTKETKNANASIRRTIENPLQEHIKKTIKDYKVRVLSADEKKTVLIDEAKFKRVLERSQAELNFAQNLQKAEGIFTKYSVKQPETIGTENFEKNFKFEAIQKELEGIYKNDAKTLPGTEINPQKVLKDLKGNIEQARENFSRVFNEAKQAAIDGPLNEEQLKGTNNTADWINSVKPQAKNEHSIPHFADRKQLLETLEGVKGAKYLSVNTTQDGFETKTSVTIPIVSTVISNIPGLNNALARLGALFGGHSDKLDLEKLLEQAGVQKGDAQKYVKQGLNADACKQIATIVRQGLIRDILNARIKDFEAYEATLSEAFNHKKQSMENALIYINDETNKLQDAIELKKAKKDYEVVKENAQINLTELKKAFLEGESAQKLKDLKDAHQNLMSNHEQLFKSLNQKIQNLDTTNGALEIIQEALEKRYQPAEIPQWETQEPEAISVKLPPETELTDPQACQTAKEKLKTHFEEVKKSFEKAFEERIEFYKNENSKLIESSTNLDKILNKTPLQVLGELKKDDGEAMPPEPEKQAPSRRKDANEAVQGNPVKNANHTDFEEVIIEDAVKDEANQVSEQRGTASAPVSPRSSNEGTSATAERNRSSSDSKIQASSTQNKDQKKTKTGFFTNIFFGEKKQPKAQKPVPEKQNITNKANKGPHSPIKDKQQTTQTAEEKMWSKF